MDGQVAKGCLALPDTRRAAAQFFEMVKGQAQLLAVMGLALLAGLMGLALFNDVFHW